MKLVYRGGSRGRVQGVRTPAGDDLRIVPISHSSLRDLCDVGFRVQFNVEFTSQVMNFPIVFITSLNLTISLDLTL